MPLDRWIAVEDWLIRTCIPFWQRWKETKPFGDAICILFALSLSLFLSLSLLPWYSHMTLHGKGNSLSYVGEKSDSASKQRLRLVIIISPKNPSAYSIKTLPSFKVRSNSYW